MVDRRGVGPNSFIINIMAEGHNKSYQKWFQTYAIMLQLTTSSVSIFAWKNESRAGRLESGFSIV